MEITGKITGLTRRLNTRSGNPRWTVWINGTPYNTGTDSQVGHVLGDSWFGKKVKALVNGSGLTSIEEVSDGVGA